MAEHDASREASAPLDSSPVPRRSSFDADRITALSAVFIGACAVAVSLYTAYLQRSQVEAQTWPFLQLWRSDDAHILYLSNRGVGPARIRDVHLRVDGEEASSFADALSRIAGKPVQPLHQSYFARRALAANEDVQMLELAADDYAALRASRHRMTLAICYCSVLNECYLLDENAEHEDDYVRSVRKCPVDSPGTFR